jgi:hypothetical protein
MAIVLDGSAGITTPDLTDTSLTSGRVVYAGTSGNLTGSSTFVFDSSDRLIVGASSAVIGNRMEIVSNTSGQAIGVRGRASDGSGQISWHANGAATEYARIQSDNTSALIFGTGSSGTERMRINSSGNLLLGTTVGNSLLLDFSASTAQQNGINHVRTSPNSFTDIYGCGTSGTWQGFIRFFTSNNAAASERMRIDSSGNLLVGTTSNPESFTTKVASVYNGSGAALYASNASGGGDSAFIAKVTSTPCSLAYWLYGSTNVRTITTNGTITIYNTTSDYRLKTVVGAVTGSGARIDALQPIEYTWNSNGSRTRGFLAHQFQEVYADSVTGTKDQVDADGKPVYQAMQAATSEVIADLVAEIQSLRTRLTALENK